MKTRKLFGLTAIIAVIALSMTVLSLTGCPAPGNSHDDPFTPLKDFTSEPGLTLEPDDQKIIYKWDASDPEADSYDVYWKEGDNLSAADVKTGEKIIGAASGGEIADLTNGTVYSVLVTANKTGYESIDSSVETATPAITYSITQTTSGYKAVKNHITTIATDKPLQEVIDAIRTDANGIECIVHFGDGTEALDIGTGTASFNGAWGPMVELTGKITGSVDNADTGTIAIAGSVSITSMADIANTADSADARAIYNDSTGTLSINGGTVSAATGFAVYNASTGKTIVSGTALVTSANAYSTSTAGAGTIYIADSGDDTDVRLEISGGMVENTLSNSSQTGNAIYNNSAGAISISGGTVQVTGSTGSLYPVRNASSGELVISGGTVQIAGSTGTTIYNSGDGTVTISGGTITSKRSTALYNTLSGTVNISGGTIQAIEEDTYAIAVQNLRSGTINISGGILTTITGRAVYNSATASEEGTINISGGTIQATTGYAVYNYGRENKVNISGGTISATTGVAVYNYSTGTITVSQAAGATTLVTSANTNAAQGTIFMASTPSAHTENTGTRLKISGGIVENTGTNGRVIRNNSKGGIIISAGTVQATGSGTVYSVYGNTDASLNINFTEDPKAVVVGNTFPRFPVTDVPALSLVPGDGKITYKWTAMNPAADSYDVYWKEGNLSAADVKTGEKITKAASGGEITGLTNGKTYTVIVTAHIAISTHIDTIDSSVLAAKPGAPLYIINGSGASYTATKGGSTVGTADDTLQNVINAIRSDAGGNACLIQFGEGNTPLSTTTAVSFNNTGGTWGPVELSGKITSDVSNTSSGTIIIADPVSITSIADITNTAATNGRAIYHNSTGTVTISGGTVQVTTDGTTNYAVNNASTGTLTISGGTVQATTGVAAYSNSPGKIIVSGTAMVTSRNVTSTSGTILIAAGGSGNTGARLEITGGTIDNTATSSRAVYNASPDGIVISGGTIQANGGGVAVTNASTGTVTISGGTVLQIGGSGSAVSNSGTGTVNISGGTVEGGNSTVSNSGNTGIVNISGGTVSSTSYAVYNSGIDAVLNISGGTVQATTIGSAVYNYGNRAAVNISGGTVKAATSYAVWNRVVGKITVSQPTSTPTLITSANTDAVQGTIFFDLPPATNPGDNTDTRLEISGGTIENTSTGNAIRNNSIGAVILDGNPTITGSINTGTGTLKAAAGFTPGAKVYTLDFTNFVKEIAVENGASYLANFALKNNVVGGITMGLTGKDADLVLASAVGYAVTNNGTTYTITTGAGQLLSIQAAIDSIKTQSGGAASAIQFGNGTDVLDIGSGGETPIIFDGWTGLVTLTGKLTSANTSNMGIIRLLGGTSIDSKAELTATSSGWLIYNNSAGSVTISGGAVSATTGRAVHNNSTGAVIISGGTIPVTTGYGVYNNAAGAVTISGGTISSTGTYGYAVYNNAAGTVNISGGTVSATGGRAVSNSSTGTVSITGGTVSATTGYAVFNNGTGKITVSQDTATPTLVTSANTDATQATILIASSGSATAARLEISGGTVSNTSTTTGNAIRNSSTGAVNITGGTVSKAGDGNYAVYKGGTGDVTIGAEVTIVGNNFGL